MNLKDITRSFKRSRLFTTINIIGLSIGLAISILLILFVSSELSFDRHFKNADRIVSLNTVLEMGNGEPTQLPLSTRKALTDLPDKVPGIDAATQILPLQYLTLTYNEKHFPNIKSYDTESSFFDVFEMEFIYGSKEVLDRPNTVVITDKYAKNIFGDMANVIDKKVEIKDQEYTISAVVRELPKNTHFSFDILVPINDYFKNHVPSIDFFTFYKISKKSSPEEVRKAIEKEYTVIISEFAKGFAGKAYGVTEKLTDIYLHTQATHTLGSRSSSSIIWILTIITLMILSLAVTNFVNLFISQSESRLSEIGIRKANGADRADLIKRFFSEISAIVLLAFAIGFVFASILLPYFNKLINRSLDLIHFFDFEFIICITLLFIFTVILSASYPAFYLSKFNTLEILTKRIHFSKRKLASIVVIFQAVISIILLSLILVVSKQTEYLKNTPIHYNPKGVMMVPLNQQAQKEFRALEQELLANPKIEKVSTAGHIFGGGFSGQGISLLNSQTSESINEYRVAPGIAEIMELELIEGEFFKKDNPLNPKSIIINEATVNMLGLTYPIAGMTLSYKGKPTEVIGVVKDFVYMSPQDKVQPMVLTSAWGYSSNLYVKFPENISHNEARQIVEKAFHTIDKEFIIAPMWAQDIYNNKFNTLGLQSKVLSYASILSILISMLGLLATQSYTVVRRTKEIAIRRINGASAESMFITLSTDILRWIIFAGIIAAPIVYYAAISWLNNYGNRISPDFWILAFPIAIQLAIALITTSGVTLKVLSRNPVEALKSE